MDDELSVEMQWDRTDLELKNGLHIYLIDKIADYSIHFQENENGQKWLNAFVSIGADSNGNNP